MIATDLAGTALLRRARRRPSWSAGLAHRPAVAAEERDARSPTARRARYVRTQAPAYRRRASAGADVLRLAPRTSSASACRARDAPALCLFVDTDRRPAVVRRDDSMEPNSALRTVGGFD